MSLLSSVFGPFLLNTVILQDMTRKEKIIWAVGWDDRIFMLVGIPLVAFAIPFIFFTDQVIEGAGPPLWIADS
jgi:hypothetical protein